MYQNKYIKYKTKYLNLKNEMYGGGYAELLQEYNKEKTPSIQNFVTKNIYKESTSEDKKKILQMAVKNDGNNLQYVEADFKADKYIVLDAVNNNGLALQYASENLKADNDIVLAAVNKNGLALQYASENLKADNVVVSAAILNKGKSLEFVSEGLKKNKEIVKSAVIKDQDALQYASEELQADTELLDLLNIDVSEKLLGKKEIALHVISKFKKIPTNLPKIYYTDKEIALAVAKHKINISEFMRTFPTLLNNKEIALIVVEKDGSNLSIFDKNIKSDYKVALAAVTQNGDSLEFVDNTIITHNVLGKNITLAAVKKKGTALTWAPKIFKSDYEVAKAAVTQNGDSLEYVGKKLLSSNKGRDIVLAAVKQKGTALKWAPDKFKSDYEVVLAAVTNTGKAYEIVKDNKLLTDEQNEKLRILAKP